MSNLEDFALNASTFQIQSVTRATASFESTPVDISQVEGGLLAVLEAVNQAGTNPTLDIKFQRAATSGGTYADVAGFTFPRITTSTVAVAAAGLSAEKTKPWVKAVATIGGTNSPAYDISIAAVGRLKS